jgi:hypothetical protein
MGLSNKPTCRKCGTEEEILHPGKTRYPLYRRLGGLQGWSGRARKISPLLGFDPRTVQPIASRNCPQEVLIFSKNVCLQINHAEVFS